MVRQTYLSLFFTQFDPCVDACACVRVQLLCVSVCVQAYIFSGFSCCTVPGDQDAGGSAGLFRGVLDAPAVPADV